MLVFHGAFRALFRSNAGANLVSPERFRVDEDSSTEVGPVRNVKPNQRVRSALLVSVDLGGLNSTSTS